MKKFIYLLLIILLPLAVNAEGVNVKCPDKINANEDFECIITGDAPYKVSAIEYEFSLPDYIKKVSFEVDPIWQGDEEDNLVLLYTDENKESPFNLGVLTLNSSKDTDKVDIKTEYLLFGDDDYGEHRLVEEKEESKKQEKEENKDNKKDSNYIYIIIVVVSILIILAFIFIFLKRRKG